MMHRINTKKIGLGCFCSWGTTCCANSLYVLGGFLTEKSKRPRKLVINHRVHENLQALGDDEAVSALSQCRRVCATN